MPAPYSAGSIFLQVVPSFRGVPEQIAREARNWDFSAAEQKLEESLSRGGKKGAQKASKELSTELKAAGDDAGQKFADAFSKNFQRDTAAKRLFQQLEADAAKSGDKAGQAAGEKYSGKFRQSLRKGIQAAQKEIDALEIHFKDGEARRQLTELQVGLKGLDRNIELGMNAGKAMIQLAALEAKARDLQDVAGDIEFRSNIGGAIRDIATVRAGLESLSAMTIEPEIKLDASRNMGAFERGLKNAINSALSDIGTVDIGATSNAGQRAVADLRKQLFDLGDLRIGVDISAETAREKLQQLSDQLRQVTAEHWSVDLDANTAAAEANLAGFLSVMKEIDGQHLDVDVDVKDAVSALTLLEGIERHGSAAGQSLDEVTNASRRSSFAGQDGANSFRAFNTRILGVAAVAPLVVPALGLIAGGIGALGPLAAVGGAGLGVLALGLINVGQAFKAVNAYQQQSNQEMQTYSKGAETAQRQVQSATEALAAAQADAARASEDSSRRVQDAQQGVVQAQQDAARSAEDSARRVSDAESNVAQAREDAARANKDASQQVEQALRGVRDAERNLSDAQKSAQQAQEDLTQARKDAVDQLDELQLRVRDNALDQRQAVLDLHQAETDLAQARADGLKGDDLEKYLLAYDRAKLRIDQTAESQQQLTDEQAKWAQTGIEGSDGVVKAQERVASANQGVLDAQQQVADAGAAVAKAREDQARTAEQGAKRIADAQQALADAQREQARQQQDSAKSISDAERNLSDARRDQARQQQDSQRAVAAAQQQVTDALDGYSDALAKTNSAQDKLNQTMAALSPTGQRFILFLDSLKPKLNLFSQIAEEGFLPGFSGWIDSIVNVRGPKLQSMIGGISGALGDMFAHFGGAIESPAFTQLFDMMDRSGPRFIGYMGAVLTNLGQGVASLIAAMEPLGDLFGTWLIEATRKFRDWAASLSGSTGLQDFFEYVRMVGPKIGDLLYNVGDALLAIGKAIAPSATQVIDFLSGLAHWISQLDPDTLRFVAVHLVEVVLGMQAIFGLTAGIKSAESAWRLLTDTMSRLSQTAPGIASAVPQVGMFAASMATLYVNSDLVRDAVNGAAEGIGKFLGMITGHLFDLKDFATTLLTIAAAYKGASLLGGWVSTVGTKAGEAAGSWGRMAMQMTGSIDVGARTVSTMTGVSKVLGAVGNALPIVGLGFGLVASGIDLINQHAEEQQNKLNGWVTDLHAGGDKAEEAAKKIANYKDEINKNKKALDDLRTGSMSAMEGQDGFEQGVAIAEERIKEQEAALRQSQKAYEDWYNALTPIEQAQANLQEAQNNLTTAIRDHGKYSDEAKDASDAYAAAQDHLKQIQYDVAAATSGLNQELLDQLGIMQTLAEAELGYEQAVSSLTDAHKRSADALAQYGANSKEYRDALLAEERAELSTADAAQRAMETRYQNADATTRQAMGQAAYYLELERQKEIYGELPPRLEAIRAQMEAMLDPTVVAAAKFYELGTNIQAVPDSKTIILDSSTTDAAITKMQDLGLHVERLPDGTVKVTADDAAAQAIIDEILKPKTLDITIAVHDGVNHDAVQKSIDMYGRDSVVDPRGGAIPRAGGGPVWGPGTSTSDSIFARLSNGEFVVKARSVAQYGLDFLHSVNQGTYQPEGGAYRDGGQVRRRTKGGLPAFADGGLVAGWGGNITLSGGNLNPLAGLWYDALNQISTLSAQAASVISSAFGAMKTNALGLTGETTTGVLGKWLPFLGSLTASTGQTKDGIGGIFGNLRDLVLGRSTETKDGANSIFGTMRDLLLGRATETKDNSNNLFTQMRDLLFGRATETRDNSNSLFAQMRDMLFGRATETRDNSNNLFAQMRDQLFGRSDETRDGVNSRVGQLRDGFIATIADALGRVFGMWGTLPSGLLGPVNTIIDKVLNNGLFKAFNAIVGALGLDAKLNIPTISTAKLAAGGKVPGWSPHDKADNIPAMLTAGEYVHPVDSVEYYGPEFMEAIRKKRIPRDVLRYADGGWVAMQNVIKKQFPWSRITSTVRPGDPGYHGQGKAIDIGGAEPYPAGASRQQMLLINRWIADNFRNITELIHTDVGAINLWHGQPHTYNAATQAEHRNHVHWAMANGLDGSAGSGLLSTLAGMLGVAVDAIGDPASFLRNTVEKALEGFGGTPVKDIMAGGVRKMVDFAVDKVSGFLASAFSTDDSGFSNVPAGPIQSQVQQVFANHGWTGAAWDDAAWVIGKESSWNPNAQNPTSTASGLGQFIDATWRAYRPAAASGYSKMKFAPVPMQAEAIAGYMKGRYGSPTATRRFWEAHHYYGDGGPVQDIDPATGGIIPDLHDTGGWLQPGLNVIMNKTGRPEPTINPQTLDALQAIAAGGGGEGSAIGTLNQYLLNGPTAREAAGQIDHAATVARRGGKY